MERTKSLVDWAISNDTLLWWLFAASLLMLLLTPIAVVLAVTQMPADYFTENRRRPLGSWQQHPAIRAVTLIIKNLVGVILLIAGLVMLLVPGQGLLTIAVALILLDFPGKFRFERWLATRRPIWRSLNWLRKRAGHETFQKPVLKIEPSTK